MNVLKGRIVAEFVTPPAGTTTRRSTAGRRATRA